MGNPGLKLLVVAGAKALPEPPKAAKPPSEPDEPPKAAKPEPDAGAPLKAAKPVEPVLAGAEDAKSAKPPVVTANALALPLDMVTGA